MSPTHAHGAALLAVAGVLALAAPAVADEPLFEDPTTYNGGGLLGAGFGPNSIASADLGGDGVPDLAVANWTAPPGVFVFRGDGRGGFSAGARHDVSGPLAPASDFGTFSVVAADFDGDADADLAVASAGTNDVAVLRNRGDGSFDSAGSYPSVGEPHDMIAADFDGNQAPDLAVTNPLGDTITILLGDGQGRFAASSLQARFPTSVASGDLDGDGDIDLVVAGGFGGNVTPLLGDGRGSFTPGRASNVGGVAEGVALGDIDLDGRLDLVVASASDGILVARSNGDGTFGAPALTAAGNGLDVAIGDLDRDGRPDLAATTTDGLVALRGSGDGTFTAAERHPVASAQSVLIDDLNGDGEADLAVSTMEPRIAILLHAPPAFRAPDPGSRPARAALRLRAAPRRARAGRRTTFRFEVAAGRRRPVRGATVALAGRRARTDRRGRARIVIRPMRPGTLRVHARKRGFAAATARLRIVPDRASAASR